MSLMDSLNSMLGGYRSHTCPDCKSEMSDEGSCEECGYGEEEESETEGSSAGMQSLLDLRDSLQTAMKIVDRIILQQSSDSD